MKIDGTCVEFWGYSAVLRCSHYVNNGRLAIQVTFNGEPLGVLTVNLPESELGAREFFVKDWSENKELAAAALKTGLFIDTGRRIPTGWVDVQIWRLAEGVTE